MSIPNKADFLKKYDILIGVDAGTNTALAIWNLHTQQFQAIKTYMIHQALFMVKDYKDKAYSMKIIIEDARKRQWFDDKKNSRAKLQGAGSIKRDCTIWEAFCKDLELDYELVHPKHNMTKLTAETFQKITKYTGQTNEHERDACMLVYGRRH